MGTTIDGDRQIIRPKASQRVHRYLCARDRVCKALPAQRLRARMRGRRLHGPHDGEIAAERCGSRKLVRIVAGGADEKPFGTQVRFHQSCGRPVDAIQAEFNRDACL